MPKAVFREERCKGCELCVDACPKKIIGMTERINRQGYRPAGIKEEDMKHCIGCALCARICPDAVIEVYK